MVVVMMTITNSGEESSSAEAISCSGIQEIPSLLWNLKVHYNVHKSPLVVPILSRMNPVHTLQLFFFKLCLCM
jgi:hypothetical protein